MLLFVKPENRNKLARALRNNLEVQFKFENEGSQVIYYNP
jgi:galactokinase/mevalonate kinase-like predicted kinase